MFSFPRSSNTQCFRPRSGKREFGEKWVTEVAYWEQSFLTLGSQVPSAILLYAGNSVKLTDPYFVLQTYLIFKKLLWCLMFFKVLFHT